MKRIITTAAGVFFMLVATAQQGWIKKEVGNNLFANFPSEPVYKIQNGIPSYIAKSDDCLFMVIVQHNAVPDYEKFIKLPVAKQSELLDTFLNNVVIGKLEYTNNKSALVNRIIKVGKYPGREVALSAINPATGERNMRYAKYLVVRDKVYSFECWYLTQASSAAIEKDRFLNSITTE